MKWKNIYLIMLIIGIPLVFSIACQDQTPIGDIPCEVVTPYIDGLCSPNDFNYTVFDLNNSVVVDSGNLTPVGDGTYNFTFNQTNLWHSYSITICNKSLNASSLIIVITEEDTGWDLSIIIVFFILAFLSAFISTNVNPTSTMGVILSLLLFFFSLYMIILILGALNVIVVSVGLGAENLNKLISLLETSYSIFWYFLYINIIYFFIQLTKDIIVYIMENGKRGKNRY